MRAVGWPTNDSLFPLNVFRDRKPEMPLVLSPPQRPV